MTGTIHHTALIAASAKLGTDVTIGPFSIVHDDVTIADGGHCELGGVAGGVNIVRLPFAGG